jgi:hypothetical protein
MSIVFVATRQHEGQCGTVLGVYKTVDQVVSACVDAMGRDLQGTRYEVVEQRVGATNRQRIKGLMTGWPEQKLTRVISREGGVIRVHHVDGD